MDNKNKKLRWAALFSQTGSEICRLSQALKREPDLVITDNVEESSPVDPCVKDFKNILYRKYRGLTREQKLEYYRKYLTGYDIITLHGWLNIVPGVICEEFNIYNGHPGLINFYPELKGKDPQIRTWVNIGKYIKVGSVVHRVTEEVDGGEIVSYAELPAKACDSLDITLDTLRGTSFSSWLFFLRDIL